MFSFQYVCFFIRILLCVFQMSQKFVPSVCMLLKSSPITIITYSNLHVPSRLKACPISMYRALGHIIPAAGLRAIHVLDYDSIQAFGTPETILRGNRAHTSWQETLEKSSNLPLKVGTACFGPVVTCQLWIIREGRMAGGMMGHQLMHNYKH